MTLNNDEKVKTITITITAKEVDAVEDRLFANVSAEWYEEHRKHLYSFWRKLAGAFDEEEDIWV